jgi:hypothetical protein
LGTEWSEDGSVVASASQYVHVRVDPVAPPLRALSASLVIEFPDSDHKRVDHGDRINVVLRVINRGIDPVHVGVDMSLGGLSLASKATDELRIAGVPAGGVAEHAELRVDGVRVFTHTPEARLDPLDVVLETGRHHVAADLWMGNPPVPAIHVARELFVNTDPAGSGGGAPFTVVAFEDDLPRRPLWTLEQPVDPSGIWVLQYSPSHPKHRGAENVDRLLRDRRITGSNFVGISAFWAETHCSALIEWALIQYADQANERPFQLIAGEEAGTDASPLWEAYNAAVDDLLSGYDEPLRCLQLKRRVLSAMLRVVESEGVS